MLSKAVMFRNVSHVVEPEISAQDEVYVVALEPRAIHEGLVIVPQDLLPSLVPQS